MLMKSTTVPALVACKAVKSTVHMAPCRALAAVNAHLSYQYELDSHHEAVERAATHSSIMLRSTRLGANSRRESNSGDSLAG